MSSLINSLKSEIARVARKELKDELLALRKATTIHRSEIAALKRQVKSLASALKATVKASRSNDSTTSAGNASAAAAGIRFSASRLAALRAKWGITQAQMAAVLDVSYLSVHKWEAGAAKPRAAQLQKIAAVMKMGKREVQKKLLG
ncbi:helix-turn-helix transcriptional regulator [Rhodoferax saidenbachensis]|uniref:DNA-binding transcriptional regulator YiaG n=1 Tax=Rhodoferax saidenbachensis TaxID=1484693 RepID=A0ABU1ZMP8_9BURK|nr:helix-turn-helix transcriptional regulator [Rhodoferax saidenbachensis]MDR7305836.1 DNA-binding transcriptional regulator YiaG [Rhodoferax saidenbachensis]